MVKKILYCKILFTSITIILIYIYLNKYNKTKNIKKFNKPYKKYIKNCISNNYFSSSMIDFYKKGDKKSISMRIKYKYVI